MLQFLMHLYTWCNLLLYDLAFYPYSRVIVPAPEKKLGGEKNIGFISLLIHWFGHSNKIKRSQIVFQEGPGIPGKCD